jgi:hypothetical protein
MQLVLVALLEQQEQILAEMAALQHLQGLQVLLAVMVEVQLTAPQQVRQLYPQTMAVNVYSKVEAHHAQVAQVALE